MIRPGFRTITPYLAVRGAGSLIDFMKAAYGAEELFRASRPEGGIHHAEVRIGDSMIELADIPADQPVRVAPLHLHAGDVDVLYRRAVDAGGTGMYEPTNQPYGSREAFVLDPCGNHWYIAAQLEGNAVPAGLHTITLGIRVKGAARMIAFLERAFGATEVFRAPSQNGDIRYAQVRIGDSVVEVGDAHGEFQPMPLGIHFYVDDVDAVYQSALREGAASLSEPAVQPYGERSGSVVDEFGNHWYIAAHLSQ